MTVQGLEGKSIIVTGSARGIGRAMAQELARKGARVVIADIDFDAACATAKDIIADGGIALPFAVDVTDRETVTAMIGASVAEFGKLDVIFNNAGIAQTKPFLQITEADWRRMMDVNGMGVLVCMQEAVRQIQSQGGGGKIINTASVAGKQCHEPLAHYGASKFAVVALTQAGARAFGKDNITVNAICPGVVATDMWNTIEKGFQEAGLTTRDNEALETFSPMITLQRASRPSDIVGLACFLASSGSDYITGQSLVVDGGMVFL